MKISNLIFICMALLTPLLLSAQENLVIKAQLIDQQNKQALAYVTIGIIGTSIGTVSAPDGSFELYVKEGIHEEQIVRFSHLGYISKDFTLASLHLLQDSLIQLSKVAITLETVEVRPIGNTSKLIGHKKTKPQMVTNFAISKKPNQNLGAAIGKKFKLGKQTVFLKNFRFFVAATDFDTVRFTVQLYSMINGKPGQLLHRQEILTEITELGKGWVSVDLSPYQIFAKGKIIATITWVYHSQKGKFLQLPLTLPAIGSTHYYRYGSQNRWKRFRGMSTAMQLEVVD